MNVYYLGVGFFQIVRATITILNLISIPAFYLMGKKGLNVPLSLSYFLLSTWYSVLLLPLALAWHRGLPFYVDLLFLAFFVLVYLIRIHLLLRSLLPVYSAFATTSEKEGES